MRSVRAASAALVTAGVWLSASASASAADAPPAINPAAAHPDGAVGGLDGPGLALACQDDGVLLIAGCERGVLHYWRKDVVMGVRLGDTAPHAFPAHQGPVLSVAVCGGLVASSGADGKATLWDLGGEKAVQALDCGATVRALAASADGKALAGAADDGAVHLWDPATGKPGAKLTGATDWLLAVAFTPDGKAVASGGYDGHLRIWDIGSGKVQTDVPAQPPAAPNTPAPPVVAVTALTFSPDGKQVAVGVADGGIHLFQAADGKFVRSLPGHGSAVTGLAFRPGGALLASASKDRTVRLWDPASGQALKTLEGHTAWVQGVVFAAQGTRLATVGADATVRLWDLTDPMKK
jgi:WD40 repeat protein